MRNRSGSVINAISSLSQCNSSFSSKSSPIEAQANSRQQGDSLHHCSLVWGFQNLAQKQ